MNHLDEAIKYFNFDFCFYEIDSGVLYTYCPNCEHESGLTLSKKYNLKWAKSHYRPCSCFDSVPKFYRSSSRENISRCLSFGKISKYDNGFRLNIYYVNANFNLENYDDYPAFYRRPIYEDELVAYFDFPYNNLPSFQSRLKLNYNPYTGSYVCVGSKFRVPLNIGHSIDSFVLLDFKSGDYVLDYILCNPENFFGDDYSDFNKPLLHCLSILCYYVIRKYRFGKFLFKYGFYKLIYQKAYSLIDRSTKIDRFNFNCASVGSFFKGLSLDLIDKFFERRSFDSLDFEYLSHFKKFIDVGVPSTNLNFRLSYGLNFTVLSDFLNNKDITFLFKYLRSLISIDPDKYDRQVSLDYMDYFNALISCGMTLNYRNLFPKYFNKAHNDLLVFKENFFAKQKSKIFMSCCRNYNKLSYSNDDFLLLPIKSLNNLKIEAKKLSNCSFGYVDKILSGRSMLFVVHTSDKPKTPYFMLEIDLKRNNLVQLRGYENCSPNPEVKNFVLNWCKLHSYSCSL